MQYRIEVQDPHNADRWGPALMAIAGTNLTPERASTFDTAEVAFEEVTKLARLQPLAAFRVVDAASGIVIWGPGEPVETGRQTRAPRPPFQRYSPEEREIAARAERDGIGGQHAIAQARQRRRHAIAEGMLSGEVVEAMGAVIGTGATPNEAAEAFVADACRKFLGVMAPEVLESLMQILVAQKELGEVVADLRACGSPPPVTMLKIAAFEKRLEWADNAAQEILTNLRALAKKLGAG